MWASRRCVHHNRSVELVIAHNPDPESRLGYLLWVPLEGGLVFRTSGTWPRTKALYCYPGPRSEWPGDPDVVERAPVRSCRRRGAAIDLVLDRARENRSQIVYTTARGRDAVFWQSPRTRKQARPQVRTPTARAASVAELEILVDAHERYAYRFPGERVRTMTRALPAGDYGVVVDGRLVASVERKSLADLVTTLIEDRYSQIFKLDHVRPAVVLDGLAELQVRWPDVPIVFCETRALAEEWTYRYLAAAYMWAFDEAAAVDRLGTTQPDTTAAPPAPEPTAAEVRAWARSQGIDVPFKGRLRPEVWDAWRQRDRPPADRSAGPRDDRLAPPVPRLARGSRAEGGDDGDVVGNTLWRRSWGRRRWRPPAAT